jgi:hypothetical protein
VFHDENQNWEEQLQHEVSTLLRQRAGEIEAEIRRLQATLNETCARLLEQGQSEVSAEEAASLRARFQQALSAATAAAERDFQARLAQAREEAGTAATAEQDFQAQVAQAREEAAAAARQEAEAEIRELREQLEASRQAAASVTETAPAAIPTRAAQFDLLKLALEEIDAQRTQSDALGALVHRAAHFAPRLVFFVVKSGNAIGWKASGFSNGLNDEAVRALSVPVTADTMLREALDTQQLIIGSPQSHRENAAVLGRYGTPASERAVVIPLVVRGKAAAVLYADAGPQSDGVIHTEALEALVRVTSMAIELLPVRRNAEQTRPAAAQPQAAPPPPPATPPPPMQTVFYGGMGDEAPPRGESTFQSESAPLAFAQATPAPSPAPPAPPPPAMFVVEEQAESPVGERAEAAAVATTTRLSSETSSTAEAEASSAMNEAETRAHNDARRFARLLVSEIKIYNEAKVAEGRRSQDLYERLKADIDRSRQMYEKRVSPLVAVKFDYFYDELVHTLGEGDSAKLGQNCPGPTVPI